MKQYSFKIAQSLYNTGLGIYSIGKNSPYSLYNVASRSYYITSKLIKPAQEILSDWRLHAKLDNLVYFQFKTDKNPLSVANAVHLLKGKFLFSKPISGFTYEAMTVVSDPSELTKAVIVGLKYAELVGVEKLFGRDNYEKLLTPAIQQIMYEFSAPESMVTIDVAGIGTKTEWDEGRFVLTNVKGATIKTLAEMIGFFGSGGSG